MKPLKLGLSHTAEFSPDGRLLATGDNRYVYLWDIHSRHKIARFRPFPWAGQPKFSPDGSRLALKSSSGRICVVEVPSGTVLSDFANDSDGEGCGINWSPDGEYLVDGSWQGALRVREWSTGQVVHERTYAGEMVSQITRSSDGAQWAVHHKPKWQQGMSRNEPIPPGSVDIRTWPFTGHDARVIVARTAIAFRGVALSPDGGRLAAIRRGAQGDELLVTSTDGRELGSSPIGAGYSGSRLTWSNDGRLIGAGVTWRQADPEARLGWRVETRVVVWDSRSLEAVWHPLSTTGGESATFSPDDAMVAMCGSPGWLLPVDI